MPLEQTWRWFGPDDPVSLSDIRQAGASGIVTALHHLPNGEIWPIEAIRERQRLIEQAGLRWSVVESVPVHEDIKLQTGRWQEYVENYQVTVRNLAACGIPTVCYNFMPALDWTRTDLAYRLDSGAEALRFDLPALAAFDLYLLQRKGAAADYRPETRAAAKALFDASPPEALAQLEHNILAGLPGAEEGYGLESFQHKLAAYTGIGANQLREHLLAFVRAVAPVAEACGIRLAIHPDDPPFSVFGLPRVVSTAEDVAAILATYDSPANGLCFCTGSFGARPDNDLPGMARRFGPRLNFLHLRSVCLEDDGSFYEANHLEGNAKLPAVMLAVLEELERRERHESLAPPLPLRPDHGHRMLDDLRKHHNPGYAAIGRLRGLAELRGLEAGIRAAKAHYHRSEPET